MVGSFSTVTVFSSVTVSNSSMDSSTMEESWGWRAAMILAIRASWSTVFFFLRVVVSCWAPPELLLPNLLEPEPRPELMLEEVEVEVVEEVVEEDLLETGLIWR